MSEADQPQPEPTTEGDPSGGEPVGDGGDAGPVDLDAETADERQARKVQGYQDDAERLRREHGQS